MLIFLQKWKTLVGIVMLWGQWITCSQMWKIKLKDNIDVACRLDCYTDKTEFCHGSRSKDGDWGNTDWTEYSLSGQVRYGTVATALRGTKTCQKASYLLALCCLFLRLLARRSQINFLLTLRPLLQSCSVPSQAYTSNPYRTVDTLHREFVTLKSFLLCFKF